MHQIGIMKDAQLSRLVDRPPDTKQLQAQISFLNLVGSRYREIATNLTIGGQPDRVPTTYEVRNATKRIGSRVARLPAVLNLSTKDCGSRILREKAIDGSKEIPI